MEAIRFGDMYNVALSIYLYVERERTCQGIVCYVSKFLALDKL